MNISTKIVILIAILLVAAWALVHPGVGPSSPSEVLLPVTPQPSAAHGIAGIWQGALKVNGTQLRFVLHVAQAPDGSLTATADSPDQGAIGLPVDKITFSDRKLNFVMSQINGSFSGTMSDDSTQIVGQWTQNGMSLPLTLQRTTQAPTLNRLQEPKAPYPYNTQDVAFDNPAAGIKLAGTLTWPRSQGPFPAVILIAGSGPNDRDETVAGHRIFLVLADYLTRHGIAVLRYDKRGVGKSKGDYATATTMDFASDALAAVNYLKTRPEIDPSKIGLVGHSEGGLIAPMVAVESPAVAFIVLMAGPGVTGEQILYRQTALILRANGVRDTSIAKINALQQAIFTAIKSEPDNLKAERAIRGIIQTESAKFSEEEKQQAGISPQTLDVAIQQYLSPWFRFFLTYDPKPTLMKVKTPVLALNGSNDLQVEPAQNLPVIEEALEKGGNSDYEIVKLPGLDHLFQTSKTGSPSEYALIEETIAPIALETIENWIARQVEARQ